MINPVRCYGACIIFYPFGRRLLSPLWYNSSEAVMTATCTPGRGKFFLDISYGEEWLGRNTKFIFRIIFYTQQMRGANGCSHFSQYPAIPCGPGLIIVSMQQSVGVHYIRTRARKSWRPQGKHIWLVMLQRNFAKIPSMEKKQEEFFWLSMSHICTCTFLWYHILEGLLKLMRHGQSPWFPSNVVELCSSFIIRGYRNNTCIIHTPLNYSSQRQYPQPAPVGPRVLKMLSVREQVKKILVHTVLKSPSWNLSLLWRTFKLFAMKVVLLSCLWCRFPIASVSCLFLGP